MNAQVCQLLTLNLLQGGHNGLKMAFVGDCQNNMTYDLMRLASLMGFHINVAGPQARDFEVEWSVVKVRDAVSGVHHDSPFMRMRSAKIEAQRAEGNQME